jgi:hypothetical protein
MPFDRRRQPRDIQERLDAGFTTVTRAQRQALDQKQLNKLHERVENSGIKPGFKGVKIEDLTRATNKDEALVQMTDILTTV